MNENQLQNSLISRLARLRQEQKSIKDHLDEVKKRLAQDPEILTYQNLLSISNLEVDELDAKIRKLAVENFHICGDKKPHPAVSIKETVELIYNEPIAMAWCYTRLPDALKLDKSLFEKHARAVAETTPLKFVGIRSVPRAQIATDLSSFILEGEAENDAEQ